MKTQLFVTALALAASTSVFAGANIKIDKAEFSGNGCGPTNTLFGLGSDLSTGDFNFADFSLAGMDAEIPAGETGRVAKVCKTLLTITVPAGYTIGDMKIENRNFFVVNEDQAVRRITTLLAGQVNYIDPVRRKREVVKGPTAQETFAESFTFDAVGDIYDGACDVERTIELELITRLVARSNSEASALSTRAVQDKLKISFPAVNGTNAVKCQEYTDWSWGWDGSSWGSDSDSSWEDEVLGNVKPAY